MVVRLNLVSPSLRQGKQETKEAYWARITLFVAGVITAVIGGIILGGAIANVNKKIGLGLVISGGALLGLTSSVRLRITKSGAENISSLPTTSTQISGEKTELTVTPEAANPNSKKNDPKVPESPIPDQTPSQKEEESAENALKKMATILNGLADSEVELLKHL